MFESKLCEILREQLGEYVIGLDPEALNISVWSGNIVLKNLQLKPEALDKFRLPIRVKAGTLGSLTLKIPWRTLGKEPVVVELDRIFLLVVPDDGSGGGDDDGAAEFAANRKKGAIEKGEAAWIEASLKDGVKANNAEAEDKKSYIRAIVETVLGNLKLSITNVHVRYEDKTSRHPFTAGVTIESLKAYTVDDKGEETFVAIDAMEKLHKVAALQRLAVYFDSDAKERSFHQNWDVHDVEKWDEIFMPGIHDEGDCLDRQFVLHPASGKLDYKRLSGKELLSTKGKGKAQQAACLRLDAVQLKVSESQTRDVRYLLDYIGAYRKRSVHTNLRPKGRPTQAAREWWRYVVVIVKRQYCIRHIKWEQIQRFCDIRKIYVPTYATILHVQAEKKRDLSMEAKLLEEIAGFDTDSRMPVETAILFRILARLSVRKNDKSTSVAPASKGFTWKWWGAGEEDRGMINMNVNLGKDPKKPDPASASPFSKEEQAELDRLLNAREVMKLQKEKVTDLRKILMALEAVVCTGSLDLVSASGESVAHVGMNNLEMQMKMLPKTLDLMISMDAYGVDMPSGLQLNLGEAAVAKRRAINIHYVSKPLDREVDASLDLTLAPIYVKMESASVKRIQSFLSYGADEEETSLSAIEAAAVSHLEEVAANAQKQLRGHLKNRYTFAIHFDIDAPKVTLPIRDSKGNIVRNLFLDFGRFHLSSCSLPEDSNEEEKAVYERYKLNAHSLSAMFLPSDFTGRDKCLEEEPKDGRIELLEDCGFSVVLDAAKASERVTDLPTIRVDVDFPKIDIHFSPSILRHIIMAVESFTAGDTDSNSEEIVLPSSWQSPDLESSCRFLNWAGASSKWLDRWILYKMERIYFLNSKESATCITSLLLGGSRRVFHVPPEACGGASNVIAIADRNLTVQQSIQSAGNGSVVVQFSSSEMATEWLRTIRASITRMREALFGNEGVELLSRSSTESLESFTSSPTRVLVSGRLHEVGIHVYSYLRQDEGPAFTEEPIIALSGCGGNVTFTDTEEYKELVLQIGSVFIADNLQEAQGTGSGFLLSSLGTESHVQNTMRQSSSLSSRSDEFFDASEDMCSEVSRSSSFADSTMMGSNVATVTLMLRDPDSCEEKEALIEVQVELASVQLTCNRPTIQALILFGTSLSVLSYDASSTNDEAGDIVVLEEGKPEQISILVGVAIKQTDLLLMYENGEEYATLCLQSFKLVYTSCIARMHITAELGNLRIADGRVGAGHPYKWAFDLQNRQSGSFVYVDFASIDEKDAIASGYSFKLKGKISSVKIIFLNRFLVTEMIDYIMTLVSTDGNTESETENEKNDKDKIVSASYTAVALDVLLESPVIVIPAHTESADCIQVALGELALKNDLIRVSDTADTADSNDLVVRDKLFLSLKGTNAMIVQDGVVGNAILGGGCLDVSAEIFLRLLGEEKVCPNVEVNVDVPSISGGITEHEYHVVSSCLTSNFAEENRLPAAAEVPDVPSTRRASVAARQAADPDIIVDCSTSTRVKVSLNKIALTLFKYENHENPLCMIQIQDLHLCHRMTEAGGSLLAVDVTSLSVFDVRGPEKSDYALIRPREDGSALKDMEMLKLMYASGGNQQRIALDLNNTTCVVKMDFIMSVARFFVPSLADPTTQISIPSAVPNDEERSDLLLGPVYSAIGDITLSPFQRLLADHYTSEEFIYDGQGHTIFIETDSSSCEGTVNAVLTPIIIVGENKRLRFKNVTISCPLSLRELVEIKQGGSLSMSEEDGVTLCNDAGIRDDFERLSRELTEKVSSEGEMIETDTNLEFELSCSGVHVEFVETALKNYASTEALKAHIDLSLSLGSFGDNVVLKLRLAGFEVITQSLTSTHSQQLIEPGDVVVRYSKQDEEINVGVHSSELQLQVSPASIQLISSLMNEISSPFTIMTKSVFITCPSFERIFPIENEPLGTSMSIWRPIAPLGYTAFGDCAVVGKEPPQGTVFAVHMSCNFSCSPTSFRRIFSGYVQRNRENVSILREIVVEDDHDLERQDVITIWEPVAPQGFVPLGCVATCGSGYPALDSTCCVREALVVNGTIGQCVKFEVNGDNDRLGSLWSVDNVGQTFVWNEHKGPVSKTQLLDIRTPVHGWDASIDTLIPPETNEDCKPPEADSSTSRAQLTRSEKIRKNRAIVSTVEFTRVWWSKGTGSMASISIWRPNVPTGCVTLGDCITRNFMPPPRAVVIKESHLMERLADGDSPPLLPPTGYESIWRSDGMRGEYLAIWQPISPPGYVSLGCIATRGNREPSVEIMHCIRLDLVQEKSITMNDLAWDNRGASMANPATIWTVDGASYTFTAVADFATPARFSTFELAVDYIGGTPKSLNKVAVDVDLPKISCIVYGGQKGIPLLDAAIEEATGTLRGVADAVQGTVTLSLSSYSFNLPLEVWEPIIEPIEALAKISIVSESASGASAPGMNIRLIGASPLNITASHACVNSFLDLHSSMNTSTDIANELNTVYDNQSGHSLYMQIDYGGPDSTVIELPAQCQTLVPRAIPEPVKRIISGRRHLKSAAHFRLVDLSGFYRSHESNLGSTPEIYVSIRSTHSDTRVRRTSKAASADVGNGLWTFSEGSFVVELPPDTHEDFAVDISLIDLAGGGGCGNELASASLVLEKEWLYSGGKIRAYGEVASECVKLEYGDGCTAELKVEIETISMESSLYTKNNTRPLRSHHHRDSSRIYNYAISTSKSGPWVVQGLEYGSQNKAKKSAFDLGDGLIVHERASLKAGLRGMDRLRSACVVVNSTDFDIEIGIQMPNQIITHNPIEVTEEVFENERFQPLSGWGSKFPGNLFTTDPKRWSSRNKMRSQKNFPAFDLPKQWRWNTDWTIDKTSNSDSDGWSYFLNFPSCVWPPPNTSSNRKMTDFVRRRRWTRVRRLDVETDSTTQDTPRSDCVSLTVLAPGEDHPLPFGCLTAGTKFYARPSKILEGQEFGWSQGINDAVLADFSKLREGSGLLVCAPGAEGTRLESGNQSSDGLVASPVSSSNPFWMALKVEADQIASSSFDVYDDWKIVLQHVLKVENCLANSANIVLWQKQRGDVVTRNCFKRCPSGSEVIFTSIDARRDIYMSIVLENSEWEWTKGNSPILILRSISTDDTVTYLNMTSSARPGSSLRICVDYIKEENSFLPHVRLRVPIWIVNHTAMKIAFVASRPLSGLDPDDIKERHIVGGTILSQTSSNAIPLRGEQYASSFKTSMVWFKNLKEIRELRLRVGNSGSSGPIPFDKVGQAVIVSTATDNESEQNFQVTVTISTGSGPFRDVRMINIEPYMTAVNRTGLSFEMVQVLENGEHGSIMRLDAGGTETNINWKALGVGLSGGGNLKIRETGSDMWSHPFSIEYSHGGKEIYLSPPQTSMAKDSPRQRAIRVSCARNSPGRMTIILRSAFSRSPYSLINLSSSALIYRQADPGGGAMPLPWRSLRPYSCEPFVWDMPLSNQVLEVGIDEDTVQSYSLALALGGDQVFHDLLPLGDLQASLHENQGTKSLTFVGNCSSSNSSGSQGPESSFPLEFCFSVELMSLSISLVDHTPQELLLVSIDDLRLGYEKGLGDGRDTRIYMRVTHVQVDDQTPYSSSPVMVRHARSDGQEAYSDDHIFDANVVIRGTGNARQALTIPFAGLEIHDVLAISVSEPVIWRMYTWFEALCKIPELNEILASDKKRAEYDPFLNISLFAFPDVQLSLTFKTDPESRPMQALSGFAAFGLSLANIEGAKLLIKGYVLEGLYLAQSVFLAALIENVKNQVMGQALSLIAYYSVLDNTSQAFNQASKGLAKLAMDEKYDRSRVKGKQTRIEGISDGVINGTESLAKGVFHGVAGIFTKPVEGARKKGMKGFVTGIGKGIVGAAAKPVSGVFDLVSKTTEGIAASVDTLSVTASEEQAGRRRYPRAIRADKVLRLYNEFEAKGQIILWEAKEPGLSKKTLSSLESYESHMDLPKTKIIMITNRRVLLLKRPEVPTGLDDLTTTIHWKVEWRDLLAMQLVQHQGTRFPHQLILHLKAPIRKGVLGEISRLKHVIDCFPGTRQAMELKVVIAAVMDRYYHKAETSKRRKTVSDTRAVEGAAGGAGVGAAVGLLAGPLAPATLPMCAALGTVIGGYIGAGALQKSRTTSVSLRRVSLQPALPSVESDPEEILVESTLSAGSVRWPVNIEFCVRSRNFERVWISQGIRSRRMKMISIWRPDIPDGYVSVGDVVEKGADSPNLKVLVFKKDFTFNLEGVPTPGFVEPVNYELSWRSNGSGAVNEITIWTPVPPKDYVSVGMVCIPFMERPSKDAIYCVHKSMVYETTCFDEESWIFQPMREHGTDWPCSLWQVDNECGTFICKSDYMKPQKAFGVLHSV